MHRARLKLERCTEDKLNVMDVTNVVLNSLLTIENEPTNNRVLNVHSNTEVSYLQSALAIHTIVLSMTYTSTRLRGAQAVRYHRTLPANSRETSVQISWNREPVRAEEETIAGNPQALNDPNRPR